MQNVLVPKGIEKEGIRSTQTSKHMYKQADQALNHLNTLARQTR